MFGISDYNKLSINDIVLKACAETIKWHSEINTSWANTEIIYHPEVHLAFGVAVEGGLLTPVIRNADSLSLEQISLEAKALIKKACTKIETRRNGWIHFYNNKSWDVWYRHI